MLILTRRRTETVVIGDNITITVLDVKGGRVRIGVNAPREIIVNREEILEKTQEGTSDAARSPLTNSDAVESRGTR